jgi:hypothetical protein
VGFSKAIETAALAPAFTVGVRVVFQDGRRREIAEIHGTQPPAPRRERSI